MIILKPLSDLKWGVSEGGDSPPSGIIKKIVVFFVGVVLVVLKLVVSWCPS
jgi:hypothetical protein